jgi:hypothetical protein
LPVEIGQFLTAGNVDAFLLLKRRLGAVAFRIELKQDLAALVRGTDALRLEVSL